MRAIEASVLEEVRLELCVWGRPSEQGPVQEREAEEHEEVETH